MLFDIKPERPPPPMEGEPCIACGALQGVVTHESATYYTTTKGTQVTVVLVNVRCNACKKLSSYTRPQESPWITAVWDLVPF